MKRGTRRGRGLLCLAMAGLLCLGGCKEEKPVVYETETLPENNGQPARLVVEVPGDLENRDIYPVLEDIVKRYQADYPQTEIQLTDSPEEEPDLVLVENSGEGSQLTGLLDLAEYTDFWNNEGSLSAGAIFVLHCTAGSPVYAVPVDMEQPMLYFRQDWLDQFNGDKTTAAEKARPESWNRLLEIRSKLSSQGRFAISRERLTDCFHSILWSTLGAGSLAHPAAGYMGVYDPLEGDPVTVFSYERGLKAVELFGQLFDASIEHGNMTEEEAIQAFVDGEAAVLIASGSAAARLKASMPAGTWEAQGLPPGDSGTSIVPCRWWGWGISETSQDPEKALHFLCYLTNGDNNTHMAAVCGTLPIYKEASAMEPSLLEGDRAGEIRLLSEGAYRYGASARGYCTEDGQQLPTEETFRQQLEEYLNGQLSGEALLAYMDEVTLAQYSQLKEAGLVFDWEVVEEEEEKKSSSLSSGSASESGADQTSSQTSQEGE